MKIYFSFLIVALCTTRIFSQDRLADPKIIYANTITSEELKQHLKVLASDEYEGRETGKKGQQLAAAYISNEFKNYGIPTVKNINGYYQEVPLIEKGISLFEITDENNTYTFVKDFYAYPAANNSLQLNANEIIFLGYGIDDSKYSDYNTTDVKDKIIMIMDGEPKQNDEFIISGTSVPSEWTTDWKKKLITAKEKGVKCVFVINPNFTSAIKNENFIQYITQTSLELKKETNETEIPNTVYISKEVADKLCNGKNKKLDKTIRKIKKKRIPYQYTFKNTMKINLEKKEQNVKTENVLGYIEGSDLKDELIVISAHYDHLGIHDGEVYNGADDDGSGTVGLLEIAEAFTEAKKAGYGPRRSILVLAFTGEEKGLLGSDWYADNPVFKLENTVCDLNIDMIGRVDDAHNNDSNYVYIIGSNFLSTELHEINELNAGQYTTLKLDYRFNTTTDPDRFYYRSDHYNFAKNNIPVIFFFNGTHEDYHKATDDIQKIHFDLLSERCKLVFFNAWTIANQDKRIEVDVK